MQCTSKHVTVPRPILTTGGMETIERAGLPGLLIPYCVRGLCVCVCVCVYVCVCVEREREREGT